MSDLTSAATTCLTSLLLELRVLIGPTLALTVLRILCKEEHAQMSSAHVCKRFGCRLQ